MKYIIYNHLEFDYDELESNEVRLYYVPDNFEFNLNLVKRFFYDKGIGYDTIRDYSLSVGG